MEEIDKIFFINLERRKDRLEEFLGECKKIELDEDKIERFNAIERPNGSLGCTLSHLEVIKIAKQRGYQKIIIFEDDFELMVDKETFYKNIKDFFELKLDFKVCMLSYNVIDTPVRYNNVVSLTKNVQTASGYIVNAPYFDELIGCLSYGAEMLERTGQVWFYINDQIWKRLQQDNKWFIFNERMGRQRESYSDLGGGVVFYGC